MPEEQQEIDNNVYSKANVEKSLSEPIGKFEDLKIGDIENKIVEAQNTAELGDLQIKHSPIPMGQIRGRRGGLGEFANARLSALGRVHGAKEQELAREAEEKNLFISMYGADPSQRPKGVSKGEFARGLQNGQFQEYLSPEMRASREGSKMDLALKRQRISNAGKAATEKASVFDDLFGDAPQGGSTQQGAFGRGQSIDPSRIQPQGIDSDFGDLGYGQVRDNEYYAFN